MKHKNEYFYQKVISVLYLLVIISMIIIVIMNILFKNPKGADKYGLEEFHSITDSWITEKGEPFETAEIDTLRKLDTGYISIFYHIPKEINQDQTIIFRSKNCITTVLVDGEKRYQSEISEAPFYNHSPGTRWNLFKIQPSDAGKEVELQVYQAYQDGRAKVDTFYWGDRAAIVLHLISAKLPGCVVSLLIFFTAGIFLVVWVILNWHRGVKDHSLLWLSVFAIAASCWCLLETNIFQFLWDDLRLIQIIDNMMLVAAGMAIYLYLNSMYGIFRNKFVRVLCGLDMGYIIFATISQIIGTWDYHQTLNGAVITYGIVVAILIVCLAIQGQRGKKGLFREIRPFYLLQQVGIFILGAGLLGDLIRYLSSDVMDRAFCMRLGFLGFITCFGVGNIYHMIQLVQKGREAEFISHLAYEDGLTKTGNRTAYLEQRERLLTAYKDEELAYVMFDLNNLKQVNDTYGHKMGDELLLSCANILVKAFPNPWKVYRIGGDEFVALYSGSDVRSVYVKSADVLHREMNGINEAGEAEYKVTIAHGAAFCDTITEESFSSAEENADRKMYENKYSLKYGKT